MENRVRTFFLLEFVLAEKLMGTISDKRFEERDTFKENVAYTRDDWFLFLALRETFGEDMVNGEDVMDIPKDLSDEVVPALGINDLLRA